MLNRLWYIDNNEKKVDSEKLDMLVDIYNAFGWCPVDKSFKPTKILSEKWWGDEAEYNTYRRDNRPRLTKEELHEKFNIAKNKGIFTFCWDRKCIPSSFSANSRKAGFRVKCSNNIKDHWSEHHNINQWIDDNYEGK
jgi:hypothetical protein